MKEISDYSWVMRGKQRRKIIQALDKPKIPTQIKQETKISLNNVSDTLRDFEKKKLAKCLNKKEKTGRLYELTNQGRKVREMMADFK